MDAHDERCRRTRLTRAPIMMHASFNSWHAYCTRISLQGQGTTEEETRKRWQDWFKRSCLVRSGRVLLGKWNIWVKERKAQGKGPWLHTVDDRNEALTEVLEFTTSRCFVHNDQHSTVRGYLAAINSFPKMFAEWELPLSHCMIVAVGKAIDRAHGMSTKKKTS